MGFYKSIYAVSAETIDQIRLRPSEVDDLLSAAARDGQWVLQPDFHVDLDKTWHALTWLFMRRMDTLAARWEPGKPHAPRLVNLLVSGERLTDTGFDVRVLYPEDVREIAAGLRDTPDSALRRLYNAKKMTKANIYPRIIWERDGDEAKDYVLGRLPALRRVVDCAAEHGLCLAVCGGFESAPVSSRVNTRILDTDPRWDLGGEDYSVWETPPDWWFDDDLTDDVDRA